MGLGKIKIAWPVWLLVIAGVAVIALAFHQNKTEKEAVTFQDIFPANEAARLNTSDVPPIDPVSSPAIVASPDNQSQNITYAVQLYSFKEQLRADAIVTKLKAEGVPAYIQISDLGGKGTWYRVRVGSYKTANEAKDILMDLSKHYKDSILVKEKK